MQLPVFKYSPNAYTIDVFTNEIGICNVCNQQQQLKYTASFYSVNEPDYICPWCIADGSAALQYNGEFNDYIGIEGVSADPADNMQNNVPEELALEVSQRTPSYISWQQEIWLSHCGEPCAFIGYTDSQSINSYRHELENDIISLGFDRSSIETGLTKDGSLVGYLFQCVNCGTHRLHVDCD